MPRVELVLIMASPDSQSSACGWGRSPQNMRLTGGVIAVSPCLNYLSLRIGFLLQQFESGGVL